MVTRRRALLGAAALAVAGCGPPEEPEVVASEVLLDQVRVSAAALSAYDGVDDVERERAFAAMRVERLQAALGQPASLAGGGLAPGGLETALAAEQRALRAHVEAVGLLGEREHRELFGELIAGSAQNESSLLAKLDRRSLETPFPGQPRA
jgi:hypothetical protein